MSVILLGCSLAAANELELEKKRAASLQELGILQSQIELSAKRKQELASEIETIESDRAKINRQLIDASSRSRALEKRITRTEDRLLILGAERKLVHKSLTARNSVLSEVLAALQRMGRKPPPALLVTPEDALSSVRSAILLGAVVPEIRSETEVLITELRELVRISQEIETQREELVASLASLAEEEERLNVLLTSKQRLSASARSKLAEESAGAARLAAKATSLNALIEDMEREISSAREAIEAARLADLERRKREQERISGAKPEPGSDAFSDAGRIAPALSFSKTRGLLPTPVSGVQLVGYGDRGESGEPAKGITLATRANSRVVTPADGWVIYAGPFRSYGQLLILDAGDGFHIVLAGMERIDVQLGQFVLVGEPVGSMGAKRIASIGAVDVSSTRPILYVEFRKDGDSIDPTPWWAEANTKRALNDS